jgi:hypothetical protein
LCLAPRSSSAQGANPAPAPGTATVSATAPDPTGTRTGAGVDAESAGGALFVVAPPVELSGEDKLDTNKAALYAAAKKAYDDYSAQAKLEPLAVKLADSVGHNRVAINFVWLLMAGFLVMFMQAGFALLETGLCRAKNAGHTMAMNFMIYPMGILGFFLCGFAFMFGGISDPMSPNHRVLATLGGYAGLNHELGFHLGGKFIGLLGWHGFLLQGVGYDTAVFVPVSNGIYGYGGNHSDGRRGGAVEVFGLHDFRLFCGECGVSHLWQLGLGWRLAGKFGSQFWHRARAH